MADNKEIRSRKELIYLNIKELTEAEIDALADNELNACDNCGEIELSENLHWLENEPYLYDENLFKYMKKTGNISICTNCKDKITG